MPKVRQGFKLKNIVKMRRMDRKSASRYARSKKVAEARAVVGPPPVLATVSRSMICKHTYATTIHYPLNPSGDQTKPPNTHTPNVEFKFRCNNMYDPEGQVGGHQPTNYDRMKSMYKSYRVIKALIEVQPKHFCNVLVDTVQPLCWFIMVGDKQKWNEVTGFSAAQIVENPRIESKMFTEVMQRANAHLFKMKKWYTPKYVWGKVDDDEIKVDASDAEHEANYPPKAAEWNLGWLSPTYLWNSLWQTPWAATGGGWGDAIIKITYWAQWTEPRYEPLN